ncbi:MAG: VOC family protein [Bacteroidia bacterium]|nr:VOC family protein [Bacteroidia bacterium]
MHTSLYVADISKSIEFYSILFNEKPAKVKDAYAKFELEKPALTISFLQSPERVAEGFGHLGIQVGNQEDLKSWHSRVKHGKLSTIEEKGTACCYAVQDKFWVSDPDGHQWEVYFFHDDSEWNDPKYKSFEEEADNSGEATKEKMTNCC